MAPTPPGRTKERVLRFVRERLLAGDPPTIREVAAAAGLSAVESARAHLLALVEEGRLEKEPGLARSYRLPRAHLKGGHVPPPRLVPLLGRVQAGPLTEAIEDPDGFVAVDGSTASRKDLDELFALRVQGDSMTGAGILEGDVVIVRRQETARDGDVVVALVGEDATVKRLRRRRLHGRDLVELFPENLAYAPILLPSSPLPSSPEAESDVSVRLLGKVIEVRRSLENTFPEGARP